MDLADFSEICGFIATEEDRRPYEVGARNGVGRALAVARPATVDAVSEIVRHCFRSKISIVPQGANTGLVGAASPDNSGEQLILSMDRLRAPITIDPVARIATVGAGVDLASLNVAAAEHDLHFPIDLSANPTIGGLISTNAGGSRVLKYGDVRRNVLGLEVVLADYDGTVLDAMMGLRKSSFGLDVKQLFIGTGGAFGIITAAKLALHPIARNGAVALAVPVGMGAVAELLKFLQNASGNRVSAFEGMSRNAMSAAFAHVPNLRNPFDGALPAHAILIELSDVELSQGGAEEQLVDLLHSAMEAGLIDDARFGSAKQIWRLRHSLSEGLRHSGTVVGFDIGLPLGEADRFRQAFASKVAHRFPDFQLYDFGHWGDGGEHFNFVHPAPDTAEIESLREAVYALVAEHGGVFSAEHGVGPVNQEVYRKHMPLAWRKLASKVKGVVDPEGILGRFRFDGGAQ